MQISSRFSIAIHIFACIETFRKNCKLTSNTLAESINVNPVIIRRVLQQLKNRGLITVARGSGGASIAKPLGEISLYDVYAAVECIEEGRLFRFHEKPNQDCPVGRNIHSVLGNKMEQIQKTMEEEMTRITLEEVIKDIQDRIEKET